MAEFNVDCPKGYGKITFVKSGTETRCPVSGTKNCFRCDVVIKGKLGADFQIKKEGSSEE